MLSMRSGLLLALLTIALAACPGPARQVPDRPEGSQSVPDDKPDNDPMAFGKSIYLRTCAACHQPDGTGVAGVFPPLANSDYLYRRRDDVIAAALFGLSGPIRVNGETYDGSMPMLGHLEDRQLAAAISYVFGAWGNDLGPVSESEVAVLRAELGHTDRAAGQRHPGATEGELTHLGRSSPIPVDGMRQVEVASESVLGPVEFRTANKLYFARCASCHGATRSGSIGTPLTPDITVAKGFDYLKAMITFGSPAGMPNWGTSGEMSDIEIDILAKYLQLPPPALPEFPLADVRASWDVLVAPADRPSAPQHGRDIADFFAIALNGPAAGLAIIDGDNKELLTIIETGDPVEELRVSATGRYLVTISRAARVDMIDLYMDPPARVATVKTGLEARALAISSYRGHEDSVLAAGSYWPPQLVLLDGKTLEPRELISTNAAAGSPNHPESRIAGIVASRAHPEFIVMVKETGQVLFVDYAGPAPTVVETVVAAPLLDAGGWDHSGRYLLTASDLSEEIAVIDSADRTLVTVAHVPRSPNSGRGTNLVDADLGPVWVTSAVGNADVTLIGADPEGHAAAAWRPLRVLEGMGGGSLYARSLPGSENLWVDTPLNPDATISRQAAVFDIDELTAGYDTVPIAKWADLGPGPGRVMQPEYNASGDEVWFSVWNGSGEPGAIVIVDDDTRELKKVIRDDRLVAPALKFNVYNTLNHAY